MEFGPRPIRRKLPFPADARFPVPPPFAMFAYERPKGHRDAKKVNVSLSTFATFSSLKSFGGGKGGKGRADVPGSFPPPAPSFFPPRGCPLSVAWRLPPLRAVPES